MKNWRQCCLLVFVGCTLLSEVNAQERSSDGLWKKLALPRGQIETFAMNTSTTAPSTALTLNQEALAIKLKFAPLEFTPGADQKAVIISIPIPDGTFESFRVQESPVTNVPLGTAVSQSHTYKGVGVEDPSSTVRLETAFDGFHAMVRSSKGVFYIDPARRSIDHKNRPYLSYFAGPRPHARLHCTLSSDQVKQSQRRRATSQRRPAPKTQMFSAPVNSLRIYRLALAANSYYVDAVYDPSVNISKFDQAAVAIVRTVNRINEIYEADLGVRLVLINKENKIIYVARTSDPYASVNSDANAALAANQNNLDSVIGSANYDIGHLFTTGTAGLASVESVCNPSYKAKGVTGIDHPTGDAFDVDYVAHEIGHQLGAEHTFNAISGFCQGNRYDASAFEPGSGSTIMGYAGPGICDPESLQDHSDSYFHLANLLEIQDYVLDGEVPRGGSCGTVQQMHFGVPSVSMGGTYIIPKGTPFVLTATAPNSQNDVLYNWEEFDLGDPAPPDNEDGPNATIRPLFRSVRPGKSLTRYFPSFSALANSSTVPLGESLPMLDEEMKFRVTARNAHGRFAYGEAHVKVTSQSGPFTILPMNGGSTWQRGTVHEIKWDVANTDKPPVSCAQLQLWLILDNNPDKAFLLAQSVPNNGRYKITIPSAAPVAAHARIQLKADGNIFFAVSPYEIQVTP